ncbi:MAG: hypothetical protein ACE5G6_01880 [Terriglobia bacterium]
MALPASFTEVAFAQPSRARVNLERLQGRLPEGVLTLLPTVLAQVPDADGALNELERFTREAGRRVLDSLARQPARLHYLLALFSHSRFLSETLIQQPDRITWLGRERHLARLRSKEDLLEDYARFATAALENDPALVLARFKRREYLRITLRDILGMAELGEITLELSLLADVLLEMALAAAQKELQQRYALPMTRDARGRVVPARFAVLSLGKLGGKELNYASDVDLLFLYAGAGETDAPDPSRRIANSEYFIRLAQRLLRIIAGITPQGPVYRVDMRLRPGGGEGDLAISLPAATQYYQQRAREWELQMLLKARHSAGDAGLVRDFLAAVEPSLYRGEMHFAAVESVLRAREEFAKKLDASGRLNVKLAPGGIRDIEFLVQCLQRLYGREDRWVRAAGTLLGLQKLYEKGYLPGRDHFRLASAYQFLRRVEHRLQLEQGQQTHTLPSDSSALALLARRCGLTGSATRSAAEEFQNLLEDHLRQVRAIYERVLPRTPQGGEPEEFALRSPPVGALPGGLSCGEVLKFLRIQDPGLYRVLEGLEVPKRVRKAFHSFLTAALASSRTFEQVSRAAAALPLAVDTLRLSEPLGRLLLRRPERLAELLPLLAVAPEAPGNQLEIPLPRAPRAARAGFRAVAKQSPSLARQMAALRHTFRDAMFRWGVRELFRGRALETGLREYTALAEDLLRAALAVAEQQAGARSPRLAVIALGRLGTVEMDLGSDADLIFVTSNAESQGAARSVAEKFIHVVSGYTRQGTLFPVDARLRPRGSEGELVQTAEALLDYMASKSEVWEAATYLKARAVAGDLQLGEELCGKVRAALAERFAQPGPWLGALREMRKRLEEGGKEDFKTGAGGLYDLDFLFSAQALSRGAEAMAGHGLSEQAERWAPTEDQQLLRPAARFLRATDHAVRLVTGRATAQLPVGPRAEAVAELAGRWLERDFSAATLADSLAEARRVVRGVFQRVFG